jgi:hypothetical protein
LLVIDKIEKQVSYIQDDKKIEILPAENIYNNFTHDGLVAQLGKEAAQSTT